MTDFSFDLFYPQIHSIRIQVCETFRFLHTGSDGSPHIMAPADNQQSNGANLMTIVPDRTTFETLYAGQPPWDIGKPQQAFIDAADRISGSILDAGCGTGDTALFLASRGLKVTGIDFLEEPIKRAKRKAAERRLSVTFL